MTRTTSPSGVDDRARLQHEPEIVAVGAAQADVVVDAAGALLQHAVERRACSGRDRADAACRASSAAGPSSAPRLRPSWRLDLGADVDLVGDDVPIEDRVAASRSSPARAARCRRRAARAAAGAEKALCMTVKPISMTISTSPPIRPGEARSLVSIAERRRAGARPPRRPAGTRSGSASPRGPSRAPPWLRISRKPIAGDGGDRNARDARRDRRVVDRQADHRRHQQQPDQRRCGGSARASGAG